MVGVPHRPFLPSLTTHTIGGPQLAFNPSERWIRPWLVADRATLRAARIGVTIASTQEGLRRQGIIQDSLSLFLSVCVCVCVCVCACVCVCVCVRLSLSLSLALSLILSLVIFFSLFGFEWQTSVITGFPPSAVERIWHI